MKVTQQSEPKFIPVVITLESQEEVDVIFGLSGQVSGVGKARKIVDQIYYSLEAYKSDEYVSDLYFNMTGTLSTKI